MGITTWRVAAASVLIFAIGLGAVRAADAPPTIDVWPAVVPGEKGDIGPEKIDPKPGANIKLLTNVSKPTLTLYRAPKDNDTGATVVICPGGGYSILAWDLEGTEVAEWLNSIGVNAVILKYRVPVRKGLPAHVPPLQDAQRAMSLVRSKAGEWGIDGKRIGMLGFSAGGNLTALACTNYDRRTYEPVDDVDKVSCRPDFGVLVYPAWLVEDGKDQLKPDFRVNSQTPPMFLVHANDDGITAANSAVMYLALKRAGVPAELHIYATAGHGFGLRPTDRPASAWPQRCEGWMKSQGLLASHASVK
ncbi:MAG: esterase/lipase [Phycisphaerales bacterium]|nr:esterase/lipase [Phycisphaerales bacterium]